ncbi:hypothetical protein TruAng_012156 [Truncatella angustata]|nr:hypothetical protein TruAng_012156 [Truncatella angustata]
MNYTVADWTGDISEAQAAGIDAFALNLQAGDPANDQINLAFSIAIGLGFQLFFSLDYGSGHWDPAVVTDLINAWSGYSAYYKRGSQPLVSTFEGTTYASDWVDIKSATGCFFLPDWSSLGAEAALSGDTNAGIPNGLFSWAAWPSGPTDMNTYGDASLWRGDDLWFDRWVQTLFLTRIQTDFPPPEFAEIITWNDYGESHYIGPVTAGALYAFDSGYGDALFNYAADVPHDGWRMFLPFLISLAKTGTATVGTQGVTVWYRNSAAATCDIGGTVGNTCSQLQIEYLPSDIIQDKIFYSALLAASAPVTVTIGGVSLVATWTDTPATGIGIYHGSVDFSGHTGQVVVTVDGIATVVGFVPIAECTEENFNPYVYYGSGPSSSASLDINDFVCVEGFGVGNYGPVCEFSCSLGYCPVTACTCSKIGPQPTRPTALQIDGYPVDGNENFGGLCSFSVNYGYTGIECGTAPPSSTFIPTNSPFFPNTTTIGKGVSSIYDYMCEFSCAYGYCPLHLCTYSQTGPLKQPVSFDSVVGTLRSTLTQDEINLCLWTATYGQADDSLCWEPVVTITPSATSTPTQTPTPTPNNWVSLGQNAPTRICSNTCSVLAPIFSTDRIDSYCKGWVDNPCESSNLLIGDGGVGSAAWVPNPDLDCSVTGPSSIDECYLFFDAALGNVTISGPGGIAAALVEVLNAAGTPVGRWGFTGNCLPVTGAISGC